MQITIIGAGIIGSTLAYRLSRAGARVTILDTNPPATAASGRSFGWINASFFANPAHFALRVEGIAAHHRLTADLGQGADLPHAQFPGALWFEDEGEGFDQMAQSLTALGYPLTPLTRVEFAALEPAVTPPSRALHFPSEGAVDAAALSTRLIAAACENGARLWQGVTVTGLTTENTRITGVRTDQGSLAADHTLIAAGSGSAALLESIGLHLPMLKRPGMILKTQPLPPLLRHILVSPEMEFRQLPNGRILAPTSAGHQGDTATNIPDLPAIIADAALARLQALIPGHALQWETVTLAERPVPGDGLPCVGQVAEGLSLAVLHSGVTLAAVVAEALSGEIMGQGAHPLLAPFRPQRLLTSTKG